MIKPRIGELWENNSGDKGKILACHAFPLGYDIIYADGAEGLVYITENGTPLQGLSKERWGLRRRLFQVGERVICRVKGYEYIKGVLCEAENTPDGTLNTGLKEYRVRIDSKRDIPEYSVVFHEDGTCPGLPAILEHDDYPKKEDINSELSFDLDNIRKIMSMK